MKTIKLFVAVLTVVLFMVSCKNNNGGGENTQVNIDTDSTVITDEKLEGAKEIFYSLPAPNEVSMILLESDDIYYDESKLNPVSNAEKYATNLARALNLGIYSADLSYASIYEQNQTVVNYMATAKKLAESLGILEAFNEQTINSLERNFNNRDSIMDIISRTYMQSDAYLKESNREEIASLIMIGGWIEGLYLALDIAKEQNFDNEMLCSSIIEQDLSLQLIMDFLNHFEKKELLTQIEPDIKKITEAYNLISKEQSITENGSLTTPKKNLENLFNVVSQIRNKYVNLF